MRNVLLCLVFGAYIQLGKIEFTTIRGPDFLCVERAFKFGLRHAPKKYKQLKNYIIEISHDPSDQSVMICFEPLDKAGRGEKSDVADNFCVKIDNKNKMTGPFVNM